MFSVAEGFVCSTENNQGEREMGRSSSFFLILGVLVFMACINDMTFTHLMPCILIIFDGSVSYVFHLIVRFLGAVT